MVWISLCYQVVTMSHGLCVLEIKEKRQLIDKLKCVGKILLELIPPHGG